MKRIQMALVLTLFFASLNVIAAPDCWETYTACAIPFNDKHNEGCKTKYNACVAAKNAAAEPQGEAARRDEDVLEETACSYRTYSGQTVKTVRQELSAYDWIGSDYCKVHLPHSYLAREAMRTYNFALSRSEIEILGMRWSGDCDEGKASGTGELVIGISKRNACKPGYWFSLKGTIRKGEFEGQVKLVHNAHEGFVVTRDEAYLHGSSSYANERDYQEALNPDRRRQRFEYEKQEREKVADQKQAEEEAFNKLLNSPKPRPMILAASEFETNGETTKAKAVYQAIKKRHPNSQEAMQAIQRLARMADAEAAAAANQAAAARVERSNNLLREQNYEKCMNEKLSCQTSCDSIQNQNARMSCKDRCYQYCSK